MTPRDLPPRVAAVLAGGTTTLGVLGAALTPCRGMISTPDEGSWPESWTVAHGWPGEVVHGFGYDSDSPGMFAWNPSGLAIDLAIALLLAGTAGLLAGSLASRR